MIILILLILLYVGVAKKKYLKDKKRDMK